MTNNLEKRILNKIKEDGIKPISKWYFILKNAIYISFFTLSIVLGAVSFSVLFYIFSNNQSIIFDSYNVYQLKNAIIFWLILLIVFLLIAVWNNKQLKNSYKYESWMLVLFNIGSSLFLGILLFYIGIGQKTDQLSSNYLNFYQKNIKITEIKKEIFLNKLKEIGITKEILAEYPKLKIKIENKFNKEVLGKRYLNKDLNCNKKSYTCNKNELKFKDNNGCGCKKIYK